MNAWFITAVRLVSFIAALGGISTAIAAAMLGWNEMALVGAVTACIGCFTVTAIN